MNNERKTPQNALSDAAREAIHDDITAYYAGLLSGERREEVERLLNISPNLAAAAQKALKATNPPLQAQTHPLEATAQVAPEKIVRYPVVWALAAAAALLLFLAILFWPRKSPEPKIANRPSSQKLAGAAEFLLVKPSRTEPQIAIMGSEEPKRTYGWRQETLQFRDRSVEQSPALEVGFNFNNAAATTEANRLVAKQLALLVKEAQGPGMRLEIEIHVAPPDSATAETGDRQAEAVRALLADAVGSDSKPPRVVALGSKYYNDVKDAMKISSESKVISLLVKRWRAGGE
jgi:hypothetical protein